MSDASYPRGICGFVFTAVPQSLDGRARVSVTTNRRVAFSQDPVFSCVYLFLGSLLLKNLLEAKSS